MVSVIITTHNRDIEMLKRAVESVREQTFKDLEIIVVDDNTYGNKYQLENASYANSSKDIIYFNTKGNEGACKARNRGIMNSKGEYITFLDDDDFYYPNKIETQVKMLSESDDNIAMVFCSGYVYDEVNKNKTVHGSEECFLPVVNFIDQLRKDRICSIMPLIKKDVLIESGLFWEGLPARQDYEMWLRILMNYQAIGTKERLFQMNNHGGEQIHTNKNNELKAIKMIYRKYKNEYRKDKIAKQRYKFLRSIYAPPIKKIVYLIDSKCYQHIAR